MLKRALLASSAFALAGCFGAVAEPGSERAENALTLPPLFEAAPCFLQYQVNTKSKGAADGSVARPFVSVRDALAAATKAAACHVLIEVAAGTYDDAKLGALAITRNATIRGTGSTMIRAPFVVSAPVAVKLANLVIEDARDAIAILDPKATVNLLGVHIVRPLGHGIVVNGATLTATVVEVGNTVADAKDPTSGTALVFSNGARATLAFVWVHHNARGLYAHGAGTGVEANGLVVDDTYAHPGLAARIGLSCTNLGFENLGAVEFSSSAVGSGSNWQIRRSALAGLYAHDGGVVTARNVTSRDARFVTGGADAAGRSVQCGGHGIIAHRGGVIDLTGVQSTDHDLCCVTVGAASGTAIDLHVGLVDRAPIGACVQLVGFDVERLHDRVRYGTDLAIPLQATSYEIPPAL